MVRMTPAVEIKNLSIKKGDTTILYDVNLTIPSGSIVGVLGPSGAGKTTLFRTIVGRQRITSGTVNILGSPAGSPNLRSQIGYLTQAPSVYGDLTVQENLRYFGTMVGVPKSRVLAVIQDVSLLPQAKQLASTLSGGQKSRLSLAVALLAKPPLLVLDEPTVGIDPLLRHELWQQFHRLAQEGTTLLVSSHVMDEADHCDSLLLIREGSLVAQGTKAALLAQTHTHKLEDAFIALAQEGGA